MRTQTSNQSGDDLPLSMAMVFRTPSTDQVVETQAVFETGQFALESWKFGDEVPAYMPVPVPQAYAAPPPPCVYAFVQEVAQIPSVRCVVAEDVDHSVHVTTFVNPHSVADVERIYAVEARTIGANPGLAFDFHVRKASETEAGTPDLESGAHFFVVWGGLDNAGTR